MSKTLDRISKVLNQAENAGTPEEAAVFMEKAQELASLAAIDLAVARSHTVNKEKREEIEKNVAVYVNSYSRRANREHFMDLFLAIAGTNDLQCTIGGSRYYAFATGFPSDIEIAKALFGQLSVQMVSDADAALKRGAHKTVRLVPKYERIKLDPDDHYWDTDWKGRDIYRTTEKVRVRDENGNPVWEDQVVSKVDGRIYRANFYAGFVARTNSRLWEAKQRAEKAAGADVENSSTALVLRDKKQEVKKAFEEIEEEYKVLNHRGFSSYGGAEVSTHSVDGWQHGSDAAAKAKLDADPDNSVGATVRQELA
jgi:hypothetical protein